MIEIRYLQAESGANKFGTCNCCGKSSGEDPLMISIKFSYYGHGTLICLCDDCKKKLMEALPPANNSEIPNSSDTISRAKAIETIDSFNVFESRGDQIKLEQMIGELPPALSTNLAEVGTDYISRQQAIDICRAPHMRNADCSDFEMAIMMLPPAQPEIIRCKDCKHWIPYDWMFSEVWQSKNIADYPEDEIGCNYCDMAMKANDFCSRGERRTNG